MSLAFVFLIVATGMVIVYFKRRKIAKDIQQSKQNRFSKVGIRNSDLMATINDAVAIIGKGDPHFSMASSNMSNIRNSVVTSDVNEFTSDPQQTTTQNMVFPTVPQGGNDETGVRNEQIEGERNSGNSDLVFHRGLAAAMATENGNASIKDLQNQATIVNNTTRNSEGVTGAYYAKHSFVAKEEVELGFEAGEMIFVIDDSDDVWWLGRKCDGMEFFFSCSGKYLF